MPGSSSSIHRASCLNLGCHPPSTIQSWILNSIHNPHHNDTHPTTIEYEPLAPLGTNVQGTTHPRTRVCAGHIRSATPCSIQPGCPWRCCIGCRPARLGPNSLDLFTPQISLLSFSRLSFLHPPSHRRGKTPFPDLHLFFLFLAHLTGTREGRSSLATDLPTFPYLATASTPLLPTSFISVTHRISTLVQYSTRNTWTRHLPPCIDEASWAHFPARTFAFASHQPQRPPF